METPEQENPLIGIVADMLSSSDDSLHVSFLENALRIRMPGIYQTMIDRWGSLSEFLETNDDRFVVFDDDTVSLLSEEISTVLDEITSIISDQGGTIRLSQLGGTLSNKDVLYDEWGTLSKCLKAHPDRFQLVEIDGLENVKLANSSSNGNQLGNIGGLVGEVVQLLRSHGGSHLLGRLMTPGHKHLGQRLQAQYGKQPLKKCIKEYANIFKLTGSGNKMVVSLVATKAPTPAYSSATVTPKERLMGIVHSKDGRKLFIREQSYPEDCPHHQLYFMSASRFRNPKDIARAKVGMQLSFVQGDGPANPNPVADDGILENNVINDADRCQHACDLLQQECILAVDCEGINLGRIGGSLCLIQIAGQCGTFLFDVFQNQQGLLQSGLQDLLENREIVKLIHDCRMDVVALKEIGINVNSILDTQIAFASLHPSVQQCSLNKFLIQMTGSGHPGKNDAPHLSDSKFWSKRPLSPKGIEYACADVELLLTAAEAMMSKFTSQTQLKIIKQTSALRAKDAISNVDNTNATERFDFGMLRDVFTMENGKEMRHCAIQVEDEFDAILECLPQDISALIELHVPDANMCLVDIVMDLHRPLLLIQSRGHSIEFEHRLVAEDDIEFVLAHVGDVTDANRACVGESSLHRCSVIYDPNSRIPTGLTIRVAHAVFGIANAIEDILIDGKSVLLIGPPGRGKVRRICFIAFTFSLFINLLKTDDAITRYLKVVGIE